jgi:probable F420-dependent oxidoreductase
MKFGLFSINTGVCSYPDGAVRIAQAAEAAGFESLWAGEHVVLPSPRTAASPMEPQDRILDPVIALTFLAAHTQKLLLGTGIIILPQRNPLVLAKELASLDVLSKGRLLLGIGVGYLEPEFRAIGVPLEDRGKRTDEYVAAMRSIWHDEHPAFEGQFTSFAGVQAHPHPVQQPHPPVIIGGHSPSAFRRAVETANGWYGYNLDVERTATMVAGLRQAQAQYGRPAELGPLEISVSPPSMSVDLKAVEQYAELGVQRLVLLPPAIKDIARLEQFVLGSGETFIRHMQ